MSQYDFQKQFQSMFGGSDAEPLRLIERPRCNGKPAPVTIEHSPPAEITQAWVDEAGDL